jgi:glycosyltransferase involved in cell wall biosynthesis
VIEFRPGESVYAWSVVADNGEYERVQTRMPKELSAALEEFRPDVIVCVGYADPEISQAMHWAMQRRVSLVTCSDSTVVDESRTWYRESLKRRVVSAFGAALVAGRRSKEYLVGLGLEERNQFAPWDVVDNDHFSEGADRARGNEQAERARRQLAARYFLCVARFVAKKNLGRLLEAYASYADRAGPAAWSLVLLGSGPEEAALRNYVSAAGLLDRVHFPGFCQYAELPAYYGLAGALLLPSAAEQWGLVVNEAMAAGLPVLVSSRCGCAPDLVRAGENGFTFAPGDVGGLAGLLDRIASLDQPRLQVMGQRSREIITAFAPAAFARGLEAAITCALARPRTRRPWTTRLSVRLLAARTAGAA